MGKAFLLLITLERAESFPLNALLDTVNLIAVIVFFVICYLFNNWDKITKKRCIPQKNGEKFSEFKLFLVISPAENKKINK